MGYDTELDIWSPIKFDRLWNAVKTDRFDNILPSWERRRVELQKEPEQYQRFLDQLKRKQAIDTGILERMYDLRTGITETFIKQGFVDSLLQHGDTNIPQSLLMNYLNDNFDAIDGIFDFVKENRELNTSYIKEMHHLITRHQEYTEAIDSFGNRGRVPLLRGRYKEMPNNPVRDGIKYNYCPPEQVASEMDNLMEIYHGEMKEEHVLVRAAFFHHSFVQIHPFQDGNGRMARLIASLILIKDGLFPLSITRDVRTEYIEALERADRGDYQGIVDVISENQIESVESALNWIVMDSNKTLDSMVDLFGDRLSIYREEEKKARRKIIREHMTGVFNIVKDRVNEIKGKISEKAVSAQVDTRYCVPGGEKQYYFAYQIAEYATRYQYYYNMSLDRAWSELDIQYNERSRYRIIFTIHHYGYDDSTFAVGAFLSNEIDRSNGETKDSIFIPMGIPPLTFSAEKEVASLKESVIQQVDLFVTAALTYITNELNALT